MIDIEIIPFGDMALLVNFEQKIDRVISAEVMHLAHVLERESTIEFVTPSYCSLLVGFNAERTEYAEVKEIILQNVNRKSKPTPKSQGRRLKIPVCYHKSLGIDLKVIAKITGLRRKEIIKLHTEKYYRVFLVGFLPGFSYLGVLPKALHCNRRESPRLKVPAGAVGIAGAQTGIYPAEVPGGWQIIGQTPVRIFRPLADNPFLLKPGDEVRFIEISLDVFDGISEEIKADAFDWSKLES